MISEIFMPINGDTLKKTYIWTVLAGIIYAGSSFVMAIGTTNLLGEWDAGIFTIALTIGNQLVTIGYYNIRMFQVSDTKEQYAFADYSAARILSTIMMLGAGVAWIVVEGYSGEKLAVIVLMLVFKMGESISDLFEGRYQQKKRYDVACRGVVFKTLLCLIGFIISMMITKSLVVSMGVLTGLYWISLIVIDSHLLLAFKVERPRFYWQIQRRLLTDCLPLFINEFLTIYVFGATKYAMDRYYQEDMVGIFGSLFMMAFVINLVATFVLRPLIAPLAERYQNGDKNSFIRVIKRQMLIIAGLLIICVAGAWLIGPEVLTFVSGIDLIPYRIELCIILLGGACSSLYQLFNFSLIIMRRQAFCLAGSVVTAVLTWFITPLVVARHAIRGGAISYLISMVIMATILAVVTIYFLRKKEVPE